MTSIRATGRYFPAPMPSGWRGRNAGAWSTSPSPAPATGLIHGLAAADVETVIGRLQALRAAEATAREPVAPAPRLVQISFSDLHLYELCPLRYRYQAAWRVPAPPDELLPKAVRALGGSELGRAVHEALAAWHAYGGDLLS